LPNVKLRLVIRNFDPMSLAGCRKTPWIQVVSATGWVNRTVA